MTITNIMRVVRDRGGLICALKQAADRPNAVIKLICQLLEGDWRAVAFADPKLFDILRAEADRIGLINMLNQRLREAFSEVGHATVRDRPAVAGAMRSLHAELLWSLVRAHRPATVVETGVCNGLSSAVILRALLQNGNGQLVSIDLPEFTDPSLNKIEFWEGKGGAAIPAGREVGWLVDGALKGAWRLEIGRSQEILESLLKELAPIDLFIHDSEHSYENQLYEFCVGFQALRQGGLLVATDVTWSTAFTDFLKTLKKGAARHAYIDSSCAIVSKT